MASKTEICNLALSHIGVGTEIQNFDTDRGQEAQACRRFYDVALDETLREFPWPFAGKVVSLALVEEDPTSEWAYSYSYPTDCLSFRRILSGARNDSRQSRIPYRISYGDSSSVVFTDQEEAEAEYTVRVTDASRYPANFILAFSWKLASYLVARLTAGDPFKLRQLTLQMYQMEITKAQASAFTEEQPEEEVESEFIRGRE